MFRSYGQIHVGAWEDKSVRSLFQQEGGEWKSSLLEIKDKKSLKSSAKAYAKPNQWFIYSPEQKVPPLKTKPFTAYKSSAQNGLQKLISKEPVVPSRQQTDRFALWNRGRVRPLLVTSVEPLQDPQRWELLTVGVSNKNILPKMQTLAGSLVQFCRRGSCDEAYQRPLKESEIQIIQAFRDRKQNYLFAVALQLPEEAFAFCETPQDGCRDQEYFWFFADEEKHGEVRYVTRAAALVDSADLNSDGRSDFLFWRVGRDFTGYDLLDGKSQKITRSFWPLK